MRRTPRPLLHPALLRPLERPQALLQLARALLLPLVPSSLLGRPTLALLRSSWPLSLCKELDLLDFRSGHNIGGAR